MPRGQNRSLEEEFFARTMGEAYTPAVMNRIQNKCFCFTGKLTCMVRNEARRLVDLYGGYWRPSVTNAVEVLVAGSIPRTAILADQGLSRKLIAARQKGTEVISEETFVQMLKDCGERL